MVEKNSNNSMHTKAFRSNKVTPWLSWIPVPIMVGFAHRKNLSEIRLLVMHLIHEWRTSGWDLNQVHNWKRDLGGIGRPDDAVGFVRKVVDCGNVDSFIIFFILFILIYFIYLFYFWSYIAWISCGMFCCKNGVEFCS